MIPHLRGQLLAADPNPHRGRNVYVLPVINREARTVLKYPASRAIRRNVNGLLEVAVIK